jgi:hypothetical protein
VAPRAGAAPISRGRSLNESRASRDHCRRRAGDGRTHGRPVSHDHDAFTGDSGNSDESDITRNTDDSDDADRTDDSNHTDHSNHSDHADGDPDDAGVRRRSGGARGPLDVAKPGRVGG